jgi:alkylation response protein AidB-like acyl-CoA dehydrogenase
MTYLELCERNSRYVSYPSSRALLRSGNVLTVHSSTRRGILSFGNPLTRENVRDARLFSLVKGTSGIRRLIISRGVAGVHFR